VTTTEPEEGLLESVAAEVAQLRDLFQRRLFEDKAKNRLYDELHAQLELARGGLADQLFTPLCLELLLVVDRIEAVREPADEVLKSVADELRDVLARRGVRPVPEADRFDPAFHEAVAADRESGLPAGTVVEVVRPGYLIGQRLLRTALVVVAAAGEEPG
jgi:molecular chaperone GrpE